MSLMASYIRPLSAGISHLSTGICRQSAGVCHENRELSPVPDRCQGDKTHTDPQLDCEVRLFMILCWWLYDDCVGIHFNVFIFVSPDDSRDFSLFGWRNWMLNRGERYLDEVQLYRSASKSAKIFSLKMITLWIRRFRMVIQKKLNIVRN